MIALLRGELAKAVSTRTFWAFMLGNAAFAALNAVLVGAASGTLDSVTEKQEAVSSLPLLVLVWGLVGVAGEYRHRTAAPSALVARHGGFPPGDADRGLRPHRGRAGRRGLGGRRRRRPPALGRSARAGAVRRTGGRRRGGRPGRRCPLGDVGSGDRTLLRSQVLGVVAVLVVGFAVVPLISSVSEGAANLTPFGASAVLTGASTTPRSRRTPPRGSWSRGPSR